jgi:hypothetical protein
MSLIKDNTKMRKEIPNRMMSATFALPIDERRVVGIVNYMASDTGITPMAFWVKLKPTDSYLDRELRASGKLISRCLQNGESLKDLVETLSQDNVIGQMANYLHKNMEDIIMGKQSRDKFPYSIECKNQERVNVWNAYDQASENCKGYEPLVVIKKNRTKPLVVIDAEHFVKLFDER